MLTAAERAWGNPTVRSMIYSYISPPEGYAPLVLLDKLSLEDALRVRFRHFKYTCLSSFRTKCEDTTRYKACLSYVHELDRALLDRAGVIDTLDVFPNVRIIRDTSRPGGPHLIYLPDCRRRMIRPGAIIETTSCWEAQWIVPDSETGDEDLSVEHEEISLTSAGIPRSILPSSWDVQLRSRVRLEHKQPSDEIFHPRHCTGLAQFCEEGLGPFDGTTSIEALTLTFQPDFDMLEAAMRSLKARAPELIPRSLELACRLHKITEVDDIMSFANSPRLERLCISFAQAVAEYRLNYPGCLTLLDLLGSDPGSWGHCKDLKHLSLIVRHDRVDQIPRRFEDPGDFAKAADAVRRRPRNYLQHPPRLDSPILPQLESLELTLWWHVDPPVFDSAYIDEDDDLEPENFDMIRDPLWSVVRLDDSEMDALAAIGPVDCRYSFKLWQATDAPASRGAMLMQDMEERLNRDVAERIPPRHHPEMGRSRLEATAPDTLEPTGPSIKGESNMA